MPKSFWHVWRFVPAEFSARYPRELNARITVHTKDGRELKQEKRGYEGSLAKPMAWDRVVEKFHWLSEAHADAALRGRIIEVVQTLDERPLSDLMSLLAAVKPVVIHEHDETNMCISGRVTDDGNDRASSVL
jgi:2-methylcitrate dehydratase